MPPPSQDQTPRIAMESEILIRLARSEDLPEIVEFNCRLARETEDLELNVARLRQGVERALADPAMGRYLMAEVDGQVVGQIMHTYEWSDWRCGMFWWLQSVYVMPDYRRSGVFSALFEELMRLARSDQDVCGLRLYVERGNLGAQKTYLNLGLADAHYRVHELLFEGFAPGS